MAPAGPAAGKEQALERIEAAVFDFDGTLAELVLDFADMKRRLSTLAAGYLGEPPAVDSLPALEWIELLAAQVANECQADRTAFRFQAEALVLAMELEAARTARLFPFTREMLLELARRGVKTAIITRNSEPAVRSVFPDLDRHCSCLLSREHVPRVKPDPDHLRRALQRIGVRARNAVMVGDHPLDIETGIRAGTWTAGVSSGKMSEQDLARSGANWLAPDCAALVELLDRCGVIGAAAGA